MIRIVFGLLAMLAVAACTPHTLDEPTLDLGDFRLGHNIVVAPKMKMGPVSRKATAEEWTTALTNAFAQRLGPDRYSGDKLYHLGVSVEGYMLAPRGIPLLYSPKSALIINVTVWDDAKGRKMNAKPHQMTILENTEKKTVLVGSGWGRTKQEQIDGLSANAAYALEKWLAENKKTLNWFGEGEALEPPAPQPGKVDGQK